MLKARGCCARLKVLFGFGLICASGGGSAAKAVKTARADQTLLAVRIW